LGSSEVSDAIAIVVSEETGAVSLAYGGRIIHRLDRERLEGVLRAFFKPIETRSGFEDFVYRFMPFLTPETPRQEP
jgi:diadenylate cyclase